jgi:hypothetical protein
MPDTRGTPEADLALLALLYAGAELDPERSTAFERLLGQDQAAREALALAAQLSRSPATPSRPDPAYRRRARARLRPSWWRRLIGPRSYRGHPLLWSGLGAAAALVLTLPLPRLAPPDPPPPPDNLVAQAFPGAHEARQGQPAAVGEMARTWATLNNHDHLSRAVAEEQRRRSRSEERRLPRAEDRRSRLAGPPPIRP